MGVPSLLRQRFAPVASIGVLLLLAACRDGLGIATVAPVDGSVDDTVILTIQGTGFTETTQVRLESATSTLTLVGAELQGEETLQVAIPAGVPRGQYDVVLSNEEGEVRLGAAYGALGHLRVISIDVGQGDATLVVGPTGRSALIDCGDDEELDSQGLTSLQAVRNALTAEQIAKPTLFFTSHFHDDHIGNLEDFLRGPDNQIGTADDQIPGEGIFDRGEPLSSGGFTESKYRNVTLGLRTTASLGQEFALGGGVFLRAVAVDGFVDGVANPIPIDRSDENQRSLVLELIAPRRGGLPAFTMLLPGDLSGGGLGTVDMEGPVGQAIGQVDVLRAGHHGSNTASSAGLLQTIDPKVILLSAGIDNPFCHPDNQTLGRLSSFAPQAQTFLTTAGIVTDGLVTDCCVCASTQSILDNTPAQEIIVNGDIPIDASLFLPNFTVNGLQF